MMNLTINNQPVSVDEGATLMDAARKLNIQIPNLCYMEGIHTLGACRVCVVEVEGAKALQASCITQAQDGMVVHTNSEKVRKARKVLYELMLSDHSQDCPSCTRNQSCEFQALGKTLGVDTSRFEGERSAYFMDASPSITRDMSKCILCRRCVTACNEVQQTSVLNAQNRGFDSEISPAMGLPIGRVDCAFCGQCTVVCPVGALKETSSTGKVWEAIENPMMRTVVQVAPAVRVALGEEFGMPAGSRVTGKMAAALRRLGFHDVFDTNFAADLTIMEEGAEFLARIQAALTGGAATLPMITSCSPGWIKYMEHHYPNQLAHLSSCKSPHTMMGAVLKSYYAQKTDTKPGNMFVVSVMPCTAKKFEVARDEMKNSGLANVDAVITTRELAEMIKAAGIDFANLPDEDFDAPLGMSSGAADIFGVTGGVMEAALRTVYELATGRELPFEKLHVTPIVGLAQVKEASFTIEAPLPEYSFLDGLEVKVAVTSGLAGAHKLMEKVKAGQSPYHFIEVMGCPGGCIMGGGQPRSEDVGVRAKRLAAIYAEDESKTLRKSHENPHILKLYEEFLGKPNSHLAHELLHTHYVPRGIFNEYTESSFIVPVDRAVQDKVTPHEHKKRQALHAVPTATRVRDEHESPKVLELESENKRLKNELQDAMETVEILKMVIADSPK